ncbi:dihydrolipoyl dehydrogenase family protein [Nonomuraea rhodomycinica]|uniref:NAD(P)/FAD-dependent oxidoreductase n=1 Tax=Nonomuraea rhodomycinica TaxID=1712872 RepID=A0A7Y6MD09_9ACTN|nr:NAD(P)/FAD-dependent oxidoreductase [Nonomuraea rhodomycinica]NUW43352.1 NAD(P)/FAD-dependent oxidoreductase [Nonomuraea rhodomycinica]
MDGLGRVGPCPGPRGRLPPSASTTGLDMTDVLVIGAGPAGVFAAHRAADLGARTTLVTREQFGGMAANDGPVPVRTLAHAARLMREARQLGRYGITTDDVRLDYPRLLDRVREVVHDIGTHTALRARVDGMGVAVHEHAGTARFVDPHTVETSHGLRFRGENVILCTGGVSRPLAVPGAELTHTHSDAWSLREIPPSMLVIGGGATGVQVASVFAAFGSRVQLVEAGPRILPSEDEDVSAVVAEAFRERGMVIIDHLDAVESFEKTPDGVRMRFSRNGEAGSAEAAMAVVAIGWSADTAGLNLPAAGVETDERGFVRVDAYQRTSVPHVFAAGDVTGRLMLVPQAAQSGFVAATNAVRGPELPLWDQISPVGSFTDPEYAQVGLTEMKARREHDVVVTSVRFDAAARPVIDGRTVGFCKLIVDRTSHRILGCHVVGERAVETTQVAAVAMTAQLRVQDLARIPLSFPTYAAVVGRAAYIATRRLGLDAAGPRYELPC